MHFPKKAYIGKDYISHHNHTFKLNVKNNKNILFVWLVFVFGVHG